MYDKIKGMVILSGQVQKGVGRGRKLGFPTANIPLGEKTGDGLYFGQVKIKNSTHKCLVFIGASETFGEQDRKAEVYILDFNSDIYGQTIEVQLLKKIRKSIKFSSPEALITQMKIDEQLARDYFKI